MPYTEKQEREKVNAAMTAYRILIWVSVVCYFSALLVVWNALGSNNPLFPILSHWLSYDKNIWEGTGSLFLAIGWIWHFTISRRYLKTPYDFQTRPLIITWFLLVGLAGHIVWPVWMLPRIRFMEDTPYARGIYTMLVLHALAIILCIVVLVLFSHFKKIHTGLEVTSQTTSLVGCGGIKH